MRTICSLAAIATAGLLTTLACQTASSPPTPAASPAPEVAPTAVATPAPSPAATADHIRLQHILIAFAGKVPGKNVTRSQDEARALANQILERAKKGENFDELVRTYTDDRAPGIYALSNTGVTPAPGGFSRERMVPAFGNVGFSLAPGEIGMAEYDPAKSPYGWHIIKRIE
jgi:parvulin-like peptidyl-prolyl isomerase